MFLEALPGDVQLFRTDSPMNDCVSLSLSKSVKDSYIVPGSVFKQLYPSDSMDFIYAFQVFNQTSKPFYTKDHLIPSLSKFPLTVKQVERAQDIDMKLMLDLRYNELKIGAGLVFDIILKPDPSDVPYSWDCLDLAVHLALEELREETHSGANLQTNFRGINQVKKVLNQFTGFFQIEEFIETTVLLPGYVEYLKTGDDLKYIEDMILFWTHPVKMMANRVFKQGEKVKVFEEKIFEFFKNICGEMKPKSEQKLLVVFLRKNRLEES